MVGHYDLWTVSLSYAIAALSGFAAFESVRHARNSERRPLWSILSGVVLGFGIWSMHFVGMLAWVPPFPLFYSVSRTVLSLLAAVLASVVAMRISIAPQLPSRWRLVAGAVFVAIGICGMHYIGMSALHFTLPQTWSLPWLLASCSIALASSFVALLLLNRSTREDFEIRHQIAGALVIGLAVCGMHYSGMRAMMLDPNAVALRLSGDAAGSALARLGVGNALIFTFCLLVISYQDRLRLLRSTHDAQIRAQEAKRTAEQLGAAGKIAASIAHEINNPLEAVINLLYLIERSEISPEAHSYLSLAQAELRRVSEITTHTLKFHRQQHAPTLTSLPEVVESVLILFANKLDAKNIVVRKDWTQNLPALECRAGEIRQVVANLVGNAIEAMQVGGKLTISLSSCEETIHLLVSDTGQGMPDEVKAKLFQPFFTTKGASGTGLGLSISAEIVARHSGKLTFDSRTDPLHHGTTFKVSLPLRA